MIRVGVLGASGTTGAELVSLLDAHPRTEIAWATARAAAGSTLDTIDPMAPPVPLVAPEAVAMDAVDLVCLCLPHGASGAATARALDAGARVIDLSGDHRLADAALHARVYGSERSERAMAGRVYGLTEAHRARLPDARLVANPGCYPTCAGLALLPLAEAGALAGPPTIHAVSGVSGAGRKPTDTSHFCSVSGDVRPYKVGRSHRHVPEIEQILRGAQPDAPPVVFSPHLVPLERGMLATCVVDVGGRSATDVRALMTARYADEPFVRVLAQGETARIRSAARSNRCVISVHPVEGVDRVVVVSAIDNLLKGAAGQAVQNLNRMYGWSETMGLPGARTQRPGGARVAA